MHLQKVSRSAPPAVTELLRELGDGEDGFGGRCFGRGPASLDAFLKSCLDGEDAAKVSLGFVPQTTFWLMDDRQQTVGMVRVRHHLNEQLLQSGGHLGHFVRGSERRKGYGKHALDLAVEHLKSMRVFRVLVKVSPTNEASTRAVLANGGQPDGQGTQPSTGKLVIRYWIDTVR